VNKDGLLPIGVANVSAGIVRSLLATATKGIGGVSQALAGWLITAIALSLGAPFWFDTVEQVHCGSRTVKPQEKSQTEKSKDEAGRDCGSSTCAGEKRVGRFQALCERREARLLRAGFDATLIPFVVQTGKF